MEARHTLAVSPIPKQDERKISWYYLLISSLGVSPTNHLENVAKLCHPNVPTK
jgi:hypothetical protein